MKNINQIAIYQSKNGKIDINIDIEHNTIWLSQEQIALLFGTQRPAITKHLRNIFLSKELNKKAVCSKMQSGWMRAYQMPPIAASDISMSLIPMKGAMIPPAP